MTLWEWIWPPARLRAIERRLDAEERVGAFKMWLEWQRFQDRETLRRYHEPLRFARPSSGDST